MAHQSYRSTTLGKCLQDSLDELIQNQKITPQLAHRVGLQFDKTIKTALANRVRNRVTFRGHLRTYKFKDRWTFFLKNAEFREVSYLVFVNNVKIMASEGKSEATG